MVHFQTLQKKNLYFIFFKTLPDFQNLQRIIWAYEGLDLMSWFSTLPVTGPMISILLICDYIRIFQTLSEKLRLFSLMSTSCRGFFYGVFHINAWRHILLTKQQKQQSCEGWLYIDECIAIIIYLYSFTATKVHLHPSSVLKILTRY